MELKLVRGVAEEVTPEDERGRVVFRIGDRTIRLHREIANGAAAGEEVIVGGELRNGVVHALALKNFTRKKLFKVDLTFYILGAGVGGYLAFLGLIFSNPSSTPSFAGEGALSLAALAAGVAMVFVILRRAIRIIKLSRWVENVGE